MKEEMEPINPEALENTMDNLIDHRLSVQIQFKLTKLGMSVFNGRTPKELMGELVEISNFISQNTQGAKV